MGRWSRPLQVSVEKAGAKRQQQRPYSNVSPRFHTGAHQGSECNHLEITAGGVLLSTSANGKVVIWPNAASSGLLSKSQMVVDAHPGGLIVCQSIKDSVLITGDFKGKVNLWSKSNDPQDSGELTVDEDGEFTIIEPPREVPSRYFHRGRYNCLTKRGKQHQKSVNVTVLETLNAEEGTFASGNSYGEMRGWKIEGCWEDGWGSSIFAYVSNDELIPSIPLRSSSG